ncbi:MAG: urease accessory protein UreJ [Pseudomonas sp. PGPPP3]|nr:MAG: urease accessory protein UreJ [Pseudomonas sp. PGPPP3]
MHPALRNALVLIAAPALSTASMAHSGVENHVHSSFLAGLVHPFLGVDHLAAMLAVGLWSALTARRAGPELLWGPLAFANFLLLGALLGLQGITLPAMEPMVATSLLAVGLLVVTRAQLPTQVSAFLLGGFALFHGQAHGLELAQSTHAFQVLAGMFTATALLHAVGLAVGWKLRSASVWLPRIAGGAVAALGSALLLQFD